MEALIITIGYPFLQNLLKELAWRIMSIWGMVRSMTKWIKSGLLSCPLTLTCCCIYSALSWSTRNGCCTWILHPMPVLSPERIPYFWGFFLQKKGFLRSMWLLYLVFHPLFTQEQLYLLLESKVPQFLPCIGIRSCTFLFRYALFDLDGWLITSPDLSWYQYQLNSLLGTWIAFLSLNMLWWFLQLTSAFEY